MIGQILTSADPEPPIGTVVADSIGGRRWVHLEEDYWACLEDINIALKTWNKIAGNYGPVTVHSVVGA